MIRKYVLTKVYNGNTRKEIEENVGKWFDSLPDGAYKRGEYMTSKELHPNVISVTATAYGER